MSASTGAQVPHTLRNSRAILRETPFVSFVDAPQTLDDLELSLLAASVLHWRRAGSLRNRGRGRLVAELLDPGGSSLLEHGFRLLEVTA